MSDPPRHARPFQDESDVDRNIRVFAWLAISAAAGAVLLSLVGYELLRAIADRLAPDGDAAAFPAEKLVYLRGFAIGAATLGAALLASRPADRLLRRLVERQPAFPASAPAVARMRATPGFAHAIRVWWIVAFATVLLSVRLWNLYGEGWDESTYIIMGSHVLEGHLPYLELFEMKPPGIFFALAGVMAVFGENLPAVHLFGTLCILVSAIAGYAIAVRQTTPLIAGASMTVFCALTCEDQFQETLTEHLALALAMPACWLLVARRDRLWSAFLVGLLLSAATLTRMNFAYVVLAVGGFYVWRFATPRPDVPRPAVAAYGLGGAVPLGSLLVVYWFAGGLDVFALSVFRVPLYYASSQTGMPVAVLHLIDYWMSRIHAYPSVFLPVTVVIGTGLAAHAAGRGRQLVSGDNGLLLLVLGAVSLSILNGGRAYGHHLLQVLPLVMLLAAAGIETLRQRQSFVVLFLGFSMLTVGASVVRFGGDSLAEVRRGFQPRQTNLQSAATMIREDRCCGELTYAPRRHLIYWYLKQRPPSVMIHPSDVARAAVIAPLVAHGYVREDEQRRLLEQDFGYIVMQPDAEVSYLLPDQRRRLADILHDRYSPWRTSGDLVVYKRK